MCLLKLVNNRYHKETELQTYFFFQAQIMYNIKQCLFHIEKVVKLTNRYILKTKQ